MYIYCGIIFDNEKVRVTYAGQIRSKNIIAELDLFIAVSDVVSWGLSSAPVVLSDDTLPL